MNYQRSSNSGGIWQRFAEKVVERAGIYDPELAARLYEAYSSVPRDNFIPGSSIRAREDVALPIGFDQMAPQPSFEARQLSLIGIKPGMRILEIGGGCGYCSAIMSSAGADVYSMEVIGLLSQRTRKNLDVLGFQRVLIRCGDGARGWKEHAPYDAIVVGCTLDSITPELLAQLEPTGGKLVATILDAGRARLCLWESNNGKLAAYKLEFLS